MIFSEINQYLDHLYAGIEGTERVEKWKSLGQSLKKNNFLGAVNFICTHNARRSVLSQSLATVIAYRARFEGLTFWSGGAEETYVHPNSIATLIHIGFQLISQSEGPNPVYELAFADDAPALRIFSKKFDDESSPAPYHAVLVCSKGDAACPFIPGVLSRTLIPFEDPGAFDDTPEASKAYLDSAAQIGAELRYFFENIMG